MRRNLLVVLSMIAVITSSVTAKAADGLFGYYMENRTCQVYTGPCFANAEIGLAGREATMAWKFTTGSMDDVSLKGLSVVLVVASSDTLAFQGLKDARSIKSVILVDEKANTDQREKLIEFAKQRAGKAAGNVVRISDVPIKMDLDLFTYKADLAAGKEVSLKTRKANKGDCVCSNESNYYPPLAPVKNLAAGVAIEGGFKGRGLGTRWEMNNARSCYMGTFAF